MPSAIPRNREKDPSVTTSGGRLKRAINSAFKAPPAQPISSAVNNAPASGKCPSRQSAPNETAANPIIEPTERSMPPVMITGVRAKANSPNSTLKRITSMRFSQVKKFCAIAEKTAISASNAKSRTHSPLGNRRWRWRLSATGDKAVSICFRNLVIQVNTQRIDHDRSQDNGALDRFFPVGANTQESERRADGSHQDHTEYGSEDGSFTAGDRRTSNHHRGDDLHFQAQSRVTGDLVEAD